MKIKNTLKDNVADTLYINVAMKCKETNKPNPFYTDPLSCDMMKKIDYDFSKYDKAIRSSVRVCIRAKKRTEYKNYIHKVPRYFLITSLYY